MSALTFRNKLGALVELRSVPATRLKNEFGAIFEQAVRGGAIAITKHATARAVLISVDEFEALAGERERGLDALSAQFEGLLACMQTPKAKKGIAAAFNASPKALGGAAIRESGGDYYNPDETARSHHSRPAARGGASGLRGSRLVRRPLQPRAAPRAREVAGAQGRPRHFGGRHPTALPAQPPQSHQSAAVPRRAACL